MSDEIAPHRHFQYASADHQSDTAIAGMWLFLATEVLFFGGLVLAWMFCRHWQQAGFDAGARETVLAIGTINLVLLLTSSFVYFSGLIFIEMNQPRRLVQCCVLTVCFGATFLVLKIWEWVIDIHEHLFPSMAGFQDNRLGRGRRTTVLVILLRRYVIACIAYDHRDRRG